MTSKEETRLIRDLREGAPGAREALLNANRRIITNVAKTYRNHALINGLAFESFAAAEAGLLTAAERFAPEKGFRFSTYATHWVRYAVGVAVDGQRVTLQEVFARLKLKSDVEEARLRVLRDSGREASLDVLAREVGLTPAELREHLWADQDREEIALVRSVQAGDAFAQERLMAKYGWMVADIASDTHRRRWKRRPSMDDLISRGRADLLQAAIEFDPDKGLKFASYASQRVRVSMSIFGKLFS